MMTERKNATVRERSARWRTGLACIRRALCLGNASASLPLTATEPLGAPSALGGVDELGLAATSPESTGFEELAAGGRRGGLKRPGRANAGACRPAALTLPVARLRLRGRR